MDEQHAGIEEFSVSEYAKLQKALHCEILLEQHQQGKIYLPPTKLQSVKKLISSIESNLSSACSSSEDDITCEDPMKREEEEDEDDVVVDEYYFLQPITTRQRRLMLRQAGIKKIDTTEKEDCKDIRGSREVCGCDCKVYCDPATCICAQAGIQCQVDRMSFPCGCTKDGCANPKGRIEFNPIRVRTHFIHTLMRLETEKKCEEIKSKRKKAGVKHIRFEEEEDDGIAKIVGADCNEDDLMGEIDDEDIDEDITTSSTQQYNSNERGSCCDCQNSEVNEFLMRESQFVANGGGVSGGEMDMVAAQYNGGVEEVLSSPHEEGMVLYNDEEEYTDATMATAANGAIQYHQFMKEESCSESSDCSSEGSTAEQETTNSLSSQVASSTSSAATGYTQYYDSSASDQAYNIPDGSPPQSDFSASASAATANSPTYKLEPISQILNPIRVGAPLPSWAPPMAAPSSSYCEYNNDEDPAHGYPVLTQSFQNHLQQIQKVAEHEGDSEAENFLDLDAHAAATAAAATSQSSPQSAPDTSPTTKPCQLLDLDSQTAISQSGPSCHAKTIAISDTVNTADIESSGVKTIESNVCNGCKDEDEKEDTKDKSAATDTKKTEKEKSQTEEKDGAGTDSEDSGLGTEDQTQSQNFGEILKESIAV